MSRQARRARWTLRAQASLTSRLPLPGPARPGTAARPLTVALAAAGSRMTGVRSHRAANLTRRANCQTLSPCLKK
eukprot:753965-Hanusia_phi.AAC.4